MPPAQGQVARQGSEKAYVPALSRGIYLQINGGLSPECCLFMGIQFFKLIDNHPEGIALQPEVINSVSQMPDILS